MHVDSHTLNYLAHLVWGRPFLWCHLIGQKETVPSVSRHGCHSELWEAASVLLSVCLSDGKKRTRLDLSSPLLPVSCSPATQTHQLLYSKLELASTKFLIVSGIYAFVWVHTCLLGCGRGTDSSGSSFSSANTGGREKPMSSSIPSRTGTGSEAETLFSYLLIWWKCKSSQDGKQVTLL